MFGAEDTTESSGGVVSPTNLGWGNNLTKSTKTINKCLAGLSKKWIFHKSAATISIAGGNLTQNGVCTFRLARLFNSIDIFYIVVPIYDTHLGTV